MQLTASSCVWVTLVCVVGCAEAGGSPLERPQPDAATSPEPDAGPLAEPDAATSPDAASPPTAAQQGRSGPWGACGPSPLSEPVPAQVLEVAEAALRPGGWTSHGAPGYVDPTQCKEWTLGAVYRIGILDTRTLMGVETADSFLSFLDQYRMAWFCDGNGAGFLEVGLHEGKWQIVGQGQGNVWSFEVGKLDVDYAPECQRAYLSRPSLGSWAIVTDKTRGVIVQPLLSGMRVTHTKAELVEQLTELIAR